MKNWEDDDDSEYCSTRQDWIDAASVADVVGVDIEAVNFAAEYKDRVFAEFLREYQAGRTPNPDVLCNAEIKFKAFLDHAMKLGADLIATGHYARVRQNGRQIRAAQGLRCDQGPELLPAPPEPGAVVEIAVPAGRDPKTEVRKIAEKLQLPNAAKKDSTGICFIGERPFREFLGRYLQHKPGPIKLDNGQTVGEHVGLSFYTLGQRKGIGIGG
jgi:tRNA-specific 2-thiouridylase